jgi:hypothetical protein
VTEDCEIRVEGHLDERWSPWLEGLTISHGFSERGSPLTTLSGALSDQSALHGALVRIRDIGIPMIAVTVKRQNSGDIR